jgi:hypothetical protein
MVLIYEKSLVLARVKGGSGKIVNQISNDCQKIAEACANAQFLWSGALEVLGTFFFTFFVL